jgi:hypothetical protein
LLVRQPREGLLDEAALPGEIDRGQDIIGVGSSATFGTAAAA